MGLMSELLLTIDVVYLKKISIPYNWMVDLDVALCIFFKARNENSKLQLSYKYI